MKYETLTLDQFDEKLRNSGFKATEKEIETIQDRVRTKMLTGTVKRAIQSLLDSARILPEDMDKVKQITGEVKDMKQNTVYMAESWFNPDQIAFKDAGMEAMKQNPTIDWENSFRPIEHQYKDWTITDHPGLLNNKEWQLATFRSDCHSVEVMDITIALYDPTPQNSDPGVLWEVGYAYGLNKPTFLVLPDDCDTPLNLMPALGATHVLHLADLSTFDFNNKAFTVFTGEVY